MKISLTRAQVEQLLSYVRFRDDGNDGGWYYGHKDQFEKRIRIALYAALDKTQPQKAQT